METAFENTTFQERLQALRQADPAMMPFGHTLGFTVEHVEPGKVTVAISCRRELHNMFGYTHGGAIFSLTDTAIGLAHVAMLKPGETATTVESKINFLRPALDGELRAHAHCIKQGRTLNFFECDVLDSEGRLIAKANATMMTLKDDRSTGRDNLYTAHSGVAYRTEESN